MRAVRREFGQSIEATLLRYGLCLRPRGGAISKPYPDDAPLCYAGQTETSVDIKGLMGTVEVADANVDDPRRHSAAVVPEQIDIVWD